MRKENTIERPQLRGFDRWVRVGALLLIGGVVPLSCTQEGSKADQVVDEASPLAQAIGDDIDAETSVGNLDADDAAAIFNRELQVAELTAECMREQGFDYVAWVQKVVIAPSVADDDPLQYAKTYGFGITTERYSQAAVGPSLLGFIDAPRDETEDPNVALVESLPPSDREAYERALYGTGPPIDDSIDPGLLSSEEFAERERVMAEFAPNGCQGKASREISSETDWFYSAFETEVDELYARVEADPRLVDHINTVVTCVANEGYELSGIVGADLYGAIYASFEEGLSEIDLLVEASAGSEPGGENDVDGTVGELTLTDEARSKLSALQERETQLAVVVLECGGGADELNEIYSFVSNELEQKFIDENSSRIEALRP